VERSDDFGWPHFAHGSSEASTLQLVYADILGITRSRNLLVTAPGTCRNERPTFTACQGVWVTTPLQGGVLDGNDFIMSAGCKTSWSHRSDPSPSCRGSRGGPSQSRMPSASPTVRRTLAPRSVLRSVIAQYTALGLTSVVRAGLSSPSPGAPGESGDWQQALTRTGRVYGPAWVDPTAPSCTSWMLDHGYRNRGRQPRFSPSQYEMQPPGMAKPLRATDRTFCSKTAVRLSVAHTGKLTDLPRQALDRRRVEADSTCTSQWFGLLTRGQPDCRNDWTERLSLTANRLIASILAHLLPSLPSPAQRSSAVQATRPGHARYIPGQLGPQQPQFDEGGCLRAGAGTRLSRYASATVRPAYSDRRRAGAGLDGLP
jgi:hypothetical protein